MAQKTSLETIRTICLMVLTALAIAAALRWLRPVMVPFIVAFFVSVVMSPLIDVLHKRLRLPHPIAIVGTVLIAGTFFVMVVAMVSSSVVHVAERADVYELRFVELLEGAQQVVPESYQHLSPLDEVGGLKGLSSAAGAAIASIANAVLDVVSKTFLVVIFMSFMLSSGVGHAKRGTIWHDVYGRLRGYMITKTATSAATAILVGIVLTALRVDLAFVFAVLTFFLNFVPNIGSGIATLLPLPLLIMHPEATVPWVLAALLIPLFIQIAIGNVLEPKLMGDRMDLHPVVVLLALIFWGIIWGVIGALLAVPITASIKLMLERFHFTAPVARMLAGDPAALWAEPSESSDLAGSA